MRHPIFALFITGMLASGCNRCDHAPAQPPESTQGTSDLQGRVIGIIQHDDPSMLHVSLLVPVADESKLRESIFRVSLSAAETPDKIIAVAGEKPMRMRLETLGIVDSENYDQIRVEVTNRTGDNADSRPPEPSSDPFGGVSLPDKFALSDPGRYLLTFTKVNGGPPVAVFEFGIIDDSKGIGGGFYFVHTANDRLSNCDPKANKSKHPTVNR